MKDRRRRTYELIVWPGGRKDDILRQLYSWGFHDYVESICDDVDLFEMEGEQMASSLLNDQDDSLPLSLFDSDQKKLEALANMLTSEFGENLRCELISYDDALWQQAWTANYTGFATQNFRIVLDDGQRHHDDREVIRLLSSHEAFGIGDHVTTRVILLQMEEILGSAPSGQREESLLDVGTGTGILAIAAYKMGFRDISATEIDPVAIEIARKNMALNQVSFNLTTAAEPEPGKKYDFIVVNILPPTVVNLLDKLVPLLKPDGMIFLAGFNHANKASVFARSQKLHLQLKAVRELSSWLALCLGPATSGHDTSPKS